MSIHTKDAVRIVAALDKVVEELGGIKSITARVEIASGAIYHSIVTEDIPMIGEIQTHSTVEHVAKCIPGEALLESKAKRRW